MISLNIELTLIGIMVKDLLSYINGYYLDIAGPSLAILTQN